MDLKEIAFNKTNKRHPWEIARVQVVTNLITRNLPTTNKAFVVFDIGSGDIFLIRELSKKFPTAHFFAVDTDTTSLYHFSGFSFTWKNFCFG